MALSDAERRERNLVASKAWRERNPDKVRAMSRDRNLRRKGLRQEQHDRLLAEQGGGCGICGRMKRGDEPNFPVDHDHVTGVVRGILCPRCNGALGWFGDSLDGLQRAVDYLRRHHAEY